MGPQNGVGYISTATPCQKFAVRFRTAKNANGQGSPRITVTVHKTDYRTFAVLVSRGLFATRLSHLFTIAHAGSGGPKASSPEIFARIL
jgi:hypothetical protein